MRKIDALFYEYGLSHQNMTNKLIHWFCVPAIFFSIVGLIFSIPVGPLPDLMPFLGNFANWATIVLALVLIYYLMLSTPLTLGMFLFSALCLAVANFIDLNSPGKLWMFSIAIFVLSWIMQFYGHKVEGKKPTFLKDLQFLLIGPAWLMHFIYKKWGFSY
ncbi:Mpo1 family 2-hydroxy fatty acid dioxygenase [Algoriphagus antarcticus]|uniref:Putative membrane protein YGL010W n=1 Tax=Algoriphagus antarcticus TaxID=238540 RepID=A0A3E0DMQ8_9BACT|nr:Mpo1-like protein [Algoriphagus antarcticus]REG83075.1 putative membrane protein YGL010W [Algoriphagus antarcticus]